MTNNDELTDAELAALYAADWYEDGPGFVANGVHLLRFRYQFSRTRVQTADEWRATLARLQPGPGCAECARRQTDLDTARRALAQAEQARDEARAARRNAEAALARKDELYDDLLKRSREKEAGR